MARLWKAVQRLTPTVAPPDAPVATKKARAKKAATKGTSRATKAKAAGAIAREGSKTAEVVELLRRKQGATLAEIMKATGWQAHSVRGFLSGTIRKKMGLKVESAKGSDGERSYLLTAS